MADFPEDRVALLPDYYPPGAAPAVLVRELRAATTKDPLTGTSNARALQTNTARRMVATFLEHQAVEAARRVLGPRREADGVYDLLLVQRDFPRAVRRVGELRTDRTVPRISLEDFQVAMNRLQVRYSVVKRPPNAPPGSDPEPQIIFRQLPGYDGPALTELQMRDLLAFGDLVRGGAELQWRTGLLRAEALKGQRLFSEAADEYARLLADPDSGPTKRKFVALLSGEALVALGDSRYRAARTLSSTQRRSTKEAYQKALEVVAAHAVSSGHPRRRRVVDYARQQMIKVDQGLNAFGARDSFVPVQRVEFLDSAVATRIEDARRSIGTFERYLSSAGDLRDAQRQLATELSAAVAAEQNAGARLSTAEDRAQQVTIQLEAIASRQGPFALSNIAALFGAAADLARPDTAGVQIALGAASAGFDYLARQEELGFQRRSGELERDIAAREISIARTEQRIAEFRTQFIRESLASLTGRELNAELYFALATIYRQLAEQQVDDGIRLAFLFERAMAFFLAKPQIRHIALNYLTGGGLAQSSAGRLITSADLLLEDVRKVQGELTDENLIPRNAFREPPLSLRGAYPIEFAAFRQSGVLDFALSMLDLARRRPDCAQVRIRRVEVEIVGLGSTSAFAGTLTHWGRFLLRDRASTLTAGTRLVPTAAEIESALATQAAVGGVVPYALRPNAVPFGVPTDVTSEFQRFALVGFEGYGPAALWQLEVRNTNLRDIADVLLHFELEAETDTVQLETKVNQLMAEYERELGGAEPDRIVTVSLARRDSGTVADALAGRARLTLADTEFTGDGFDGRTAVVHTVVAQVLDAEGAGIAGAEVTIGKTGAALRVSRTTGADGMTEDLTAGAPPPLPPEQRPAAAGVWTVRLAVPAATPAVDDILLFFVCVQAAA